MCHQAAPRGSPESSVAMSATSDDAGRRASTSGASDYGSDVPPTRRPDATSLGGTPRRPVRTCVLARYRSRLSASRSIPTSTARSVRSSSRSISNSAKARLGASLTSSDVGSVTKRHQACVSKGDKRWIAYGPVEEGPMPAVRMLLSDAREKAARDRRRMEARFRRAPFPLYGLPSSWEGGRFLGGGSWGGVRGRVRTRSLSLVHGVLVEGEGPILVVETALPDEPGGGGPLRILAEELWRGEANDVLEAVELLRRRWVAHPHHAEFSPLPSRTEHDFSVEARPEAFDVLSQPSRWVARATVEGFDVTLEGVTFPPEGVSLVRITDLASYILGTRRFEGGENL
jgi:hypothetical protein